MKIARKEEAIRRGESEKTGRTSALKRWIWETVVGVMDLVMNTMEENMKIVQTYNEDMRMSI